MDFYRIDVPLLGARRGLLRPVNREAMLHGLLRILFGEDRRIGLLLKRKQQDGQASQ